MIFRTDRQESAFAAALGAYYAMYRCPIVPTQKDAIEIQRLADDIKPYSHTFTNLYSQSGAVASIIASDVGCVNQGNMLAQAWIEFDSARDEFYFYWES